jgi:hypothetical protein
MATTRQNLRRNLSYMMGDFILDPDGSIPTCSSQGGVSGATAFDTLLSYYDDDYFNEWFFLLPSGPSSGSTAYGVTRVTNFISTTGEMELEPNAAARIDSGRTYELHRYSPAWKHRALNAARLHAVDVLHLPEPDSTLVVDNLIATNNSFETAVSGSPTATSGWTKGGTSTLYDETTLRRHLTNSLKVLETDGAVTQLFQAVTPNITEAVGKTINLRVWVYATVASAARVGISFDNGTSITYSNYHGGEDEWEDLDVSTAITASALSIRVYLEVAASQTAYFDLARAWIDKVNRYTLPTNFYRGPVKIEQQASMSHPDGDYLPLTKYNRPQPGRVLHINGKRLLSEVTSETGTMEVSEPEDQLLYAHALEWLADSNMGMASGAVRDDIEADKQRWRVKAAELRIRASIKPPDLPIYAEQNGVWEIRWEGETGRLILKNR